MSQACNSWVNSWDYRSNLWTEVGSACSLWDMTKTCDTKRHFSPFSPMSKCGSIRALLFYTILCYMKNYSVSLYYALTKKYMWVSAGNISEAAYVLSVMYFLFIFLHRTSSLSVRQIVCQILDVAREGSKTERSSKERSGWKAVKLGGGEGGDGVVGRGLLLGNNDTLKDEKRKRWDKPRLMWCNVGKGKDKTRGRWEERRPASGRDATGSPCTHRSARGANNQIPVIECSVN